MARGVKSTDGFAARVSKYVPAEVLAFYITVENVLRELFNRALPGGKPVAAGGTQAGGSAAVTAADQFLVDNGAGLLIILCIVLIPVYLIYNSEKGADKYWRHSAISVVLFLIWIYSLNGVVFDQGVKFLNVLPGFNLSNYYSASLSAIFMALVTAASGLFTVSDSPGGTNEIAGPAM